MPAVGGPRWFEIPIVWFMIGVGEFAILGALTRAFLPRDLPTVLGVATFLALAGGVAWANYRILQRLRRS